MSEARVTNLSFAGSGSGFDDGRANGRICRAKGHVMQRDTRNEKTGEWYPEISQDGRCLVCHQAVAELVVDNESPRD